jgi:hypothetical protein
MPGARKRQTLGKNADRTRSQSFGKDSTNGGRENEGLPRTAANGDLAPIDRQGLDRIAAVHSDGLTNPGLGTPVGTPDGRTAIRLCMPYRASVVTEWSEQKTPSGRFKGHAPARAPRLRPETGQIDLGHTQSTRHGCLMIGPHVLGGIGCAGLSIRLLGQIPHPASGSHLFGSKSGAPTR